jgi:predicted nucleotide-binding protein (sugar kinase/HSP70/actin superfamily)
MIVSEWNNLSFEDSLNAATEFYNSTDEVFLKSIAVTPYWDLSKEFKAFVDDMKSPAPFKSTCVEEKPELGSI